MINLHGGNKQNFDFQKIKRLKVDIFWFNLFRKIDDFQCKIKFFPGIYFWSGSIKRKKD